MSAGMAEERSSGGWDTMPNKSAHTQPVACATSVYGLNVRKKIVTELNLRSISVVTSRLGIALFCIWLGSHIFIQSHQTKSIAAVIIIIYLLAQIMVSVLAQFRGLPTSDLLFQTVTSSVLIIFLLLSFPVIMKQN